jgi:hypothetical protein
MSDSSTLKRTSSASATPPASSVKLYVMPKVRALDLPRRACADARNAVVVLLLASDLADDQNQGPRDATEGEVAGER